MAYIVEPGVMWTQLDHNVRIVSKLLWRSDHPLEIVILFGESGSDTSIDEKNVVWKFSRDLITEAAKNGTSGLGDVQVKVDAAARLTLRLESPSGVVRLRTEAITILQFVQRTYREVNETDEVDLLHLTNEEIREAMLDWGLL